MLIIEDPKAIRLESYGVDFDEQEAIQRNTPKDTIYPQYPQWGEKK